MTRLPRLGRLWLAEMYAALRRLQDDADDVLDLTTPVREPETTTGGRHG